MKKINSKKLSKISGGASNGCGTIGFMWVISHASGAFGLISGNYYSTLAGVCWDN